MSPGCGQRSRGPNKDWRNEVIFAWIGAKAGKSKDTEFGSKEAQLLNQASYVKKKFTWNECKMIHPQLVS